MPTCQISWIPKNAPLRTASLVRFAANRLGRVALAMVAVGLCLFSGCRVFNADGPEPVPTGMETVANPLPVSPLDRMVVMDQVSDELDDYFRIWREERVRLVDGLMTEGWIETHPQIGGTWLEPWKKDSARGFEKAHATLQTVRRFAKARVIPASNGYLIDLRVYKELEDLPDPQHSPVTGRLMRHDNSLDIDRELQSTVQPNQGWIPMGRDLVIEQEILARIQSRLQKCSSQQ